jgi:alpha-galactosidase
LQRRAGKDRHGLRVRAVIAVLWRGGLRISEALALGETDVDPARGSVLIRHGKGDRRREVGMDGWGFEHLNRLLEHRGQLPVGGMDTAKSAIAAEHPEWLVRTETGPPVLALHNWGQDTYPLDVTHPGAQDYLTSVFRQAIDIGIDFFKIDFVYAAALDGRRYDASLTSGQAYRHGLAHLRSVLGPEPYLLGCGAPLLPSVGMVDAMRVSADTAPLWAPEHGDMSLAGGQSAELSVHARSYQHGRHWVNDPDCLWLRPDVERRQRRAGMVKQHGGLRGFSDRVANHDDWALSTTAELLTLVPPPTPFR